MKKNLKTIIAMSMITAGLFLGTACSSDSDGESNTTNTNTQNQNAENNNKTVTLTAPSSYEVANSDERFELKDTYVAYIKVTENIDGEIVNSVRTETIYIYALDANSDKYSDLLKAVRSVIKTVAIKKENSTEDYKYQEFDGYFRTSSSDKMTITKLYNTVSENLEKLTTEKEVSIDCNDDTFTYNGVTYKKQ